MDAKAYNDLGAVLIEAGRFREAQGALEQSLALDAGDAMTWTNLSIALAEQAFLADAIAACRRANRLDPSYLSAHLLLSHYLLRAGDYQEGFREYEWRWKYKQEFLERQFPAPRWEGEVLNGRSILLHVEQGMGDMIQFARYVPLVAQRGGRVFLECYAELLRLFQTLRGVEAIVPFGSAIPRVDLHCPIGRMPLVFGTTVATIPANIPYLRPEPPLAEFFRQRLASDGSRFKIGLVWAGRRQHRQDARRSLDLSQLAPLALPDITFYSLQKGDAGGQASGPPPGMRLVDPTASLNDFADTAALIAHLDLVITVDTGVAHLAGAIGKPVWVLIPFIPDWRWMINRDDSPWYPSMRLFRQRTRGDWEQVLLRMRECLISLAATKRTDFVCRK